MSNRWGWILAIALVGGARAGEPLGYKDLRIGDALAAVKETKNYMRCEEYSASKGTWCFADPFPTQGAKSDEITRIGSIPVNVALVFLQSRLHVIFVDFDTESYTIIKQALISKYGPENHRSIDVKTNGMIKVSSETLEWTRDGILLKIEEQASKLGRGRMGIYNHRVKRKPVTKDDL